MIILRDYQLDVLERVRAAMRRGTKRVLMVMPTGSGKTVCFSSIAEGAAMRRKYVLILAHRVELIDQICASLTDFGVEPDVIAPGYERASSHVCVASVLSLIRRLDNIVPPDLIICDEAHHVTTSRDGGNSWGKIFRAFPQAYHLGVTATPVRLDGRGLGEFFDELVIGPQIHELQAVEHLARCRIFAPPTVSLDGLHSRMGDYLAAESEARVNQRAITGDALSHYRRHADGRRALVFAISVAHAAAIAEQFREGGYQAVHLDGGTASTLRRAVVADFQAGRLQVLVSCDLFSEGFDCPGAEVGVMLRPTMSFGLYRQQVGRILRPAPGKVAILLDHVGNTALHGLPDEPIDWSLERDGKVRSKGTGVKVCGQCFAAIAQSARVCPECGLAFGGSKPRQIETQDGELAEITPEQLASRARRRAQGRARSLEELQRFGASKGYAPGWALKVWEARQAKRA